MVRARLRTCRNLFVADGQSLNLQPDFGTTYPQVIASSHPSLQVKVAALGGTSWTDLADTQAARLNTMANSATNTMLVLCGGTGDVVLENDSGATIYADMVAYASAARSAGFDKIAAQTITKTTGMTGGQNTSRTDANTLLLADASHAFDAVIDVAANANLSDPTNTTYYFDGIHWTTAGAAIAAGLVDPTVSSWLV